MIDFALILKIEGNMLPALRCVASAISGAGLFGLLLLVAPAAWGQGGDARALYDRADKAFQAGRYAEAASLFGRALAKFEKTLGPRHPNVAASLLGLADVNRAQGRFAQAEPLYRRALAINEKTLGPQHHHTALSLSGLANVYEAQGRYAEAEPLHRRAAAILEKVLGPHPDTAASLIGLAKVYRAQGRLAEAEPLHRRALAMNEKALGPEHPHVGYSLSGLAHVFVVQGRYTEAEPLYRRALAITEKALGPEHSHTAVSLSSLGQLYEAQGRYAEAEPLLRRALAIDEKALGPEHPETAGGLSNLAILYRRQGRYAEAEPLQRRALTIKEKVLGPEHPHTAISITELAIVCAAQGRYAEAESLHRRSLEIRLKAHGSEHYSTAVGLSNLAAVYRIQGRHAEAEPLNRRALAIDEKTFGPEHPNTAVSLNGLANIYQAQGRYAEAEPLIQRALAVWQKALGPEHPFTALDLANLGRLKSALQDWPEAYKVLSRAAAIYIRREQRGGDPLGVVGAELQPSRIRATFGDFISAAASLAKASPERADPLAGEAFTAAQWGQRSTVATALASMAARFAKGDAALAGLVRQRQDLVADYRKMDKLLVAASSKPPAKRKAAEEAALRVKVDTTGKQIDAIDLQLKLRFPEYAAVSNPEPLTIAETQKHLNDDEALYQVFVDEGNDRDRIFAWVVTKDGARFRALDLSPQQMAEHVEALRCGLDASRWRDERGLGRIKTGRERCRDLVGDDANEPLPFDLKRARALYNGLFGPFAELIKGKRLLIVADGALTALPFHVLVTAPPDESAATPAERYRKAAWLVAQHPITVLPSVSSLKALRATAGRSPAPKAYTAFANPLLTGKDGTDRSAWSKVACPPAGAVKIAAASAAPPRGTLRSFFRGGIADAEALTRQPPLPETTDEVCAVAASLGSGTDAVLLGARTTETAVKELSRKGDLKRFRIVHFATHGLIATETKELAAGSLAEPGLILTPPKTATEQDDGLLTASEVAQLDLNADFVILSACNTAASDGAPNAQALSGLTRAFLYAGARALLVSHWAVDTWAAVDLVTGTFATLQQEPSLGRAEALQRAMLAQIAQGGKRAHPSYWAPFVIVGKGR